MKCFVINLEREIKRRQSAGLQLSKLGIDCEIFKAIDHRTAPPDQLPRVSKLGFLIEVGYQPSAGEIGCYASHLALWKRCVALDESILILEDDFLADDRLPDALKFIEPHANRLGFVRLEPVSYRNESRNNLDSAAELSDGNFAIHAVTNKIPARLTGYVIAPRAAAAFIGMSTSVRMPVDHLPKRNWRLGQSFYALQPPVISISQHSLESSITGRQKTALRHLVGPVRALNRYYWRHIQRSRQKGA